MTTRAHVRWKGRVLMCDRDTCPRVFAACDYLPVHATHPNRLRDVLARPHRDIDMYLVRHEPDLTDTTDLVRMLRGADDRAAILVYARSADFAPHGRRSAAPASAGSLRERVLAAGADLCLHGLDWSCPREADRVLGLLAAAKQARLKLLWQERWGRIRTAAETTATWQSVVATIMAWHREDGYTRGWLFTFAPHVKRFECDASFGPDAHRQGDRSLAYADVEPLLQVVQDHAVTYWELDRLREIYLVHNRNVPGFFEAAYAGHAGSAPLGWVYATLTHGSAIVAHLVVDRARAEASEITAMNIHALEQFSLQAPAVLQALRDDEARPYAIAPGLPRAPSTGTAVSGNRIIREDPSFRRVLAVAKTIAELDDPVLILGETGVGKEVVARYIHEHSHVRDRKFLAVNCAAMVSTLTNELFGSIKGAFTGATDRVGYFEAVDGGTLFLDEIGDLALEIQARILRVLETGELVRVGDTQPRPVRFRLVCATNRALEELIGDGGFRPDLYYRISSHCVTVPPLRERPRDLDAFVRRTLRRFNQASGRDVSVDAAARAAMHRYPWPGNVRQLLNVLNHVLALSGSGRVITAETLRTLWLPGSPAASPRVPHPVGSGGSRASHADEDASSPPTLRPEAPPPEPPRSDDAAMVLERLRGGEGDFWSLVQRPFKERRMTRDQVREIVALGLTATLGSYKQTAILFGLDPRSDYKRFMDFLRTHGLHLDYRPFRRRHFLER